MKKKYKITENQNISKNIIKLHKMLKIYSNASQCMKTHYNT